MTKFGCGNLSKSQAKRFERFLSRSLVLTLPPLASACIKSTTLLRTLHCRESKSTSRTRMSEGNAYFESPLPYCQAPAKVCTSFVLCGLLNHVPGRHCPASVSNNLFVKRGILLCRYSRYHRSDKFLRQRTLLSQGLQDRRDHIQALRHR